MEDFIVYIVIFGLLFYLYKTLKLNKNKKSLKENISTSNKFSSLLPESVIDNINSGVLCEYTPPSEVILLPGEICHFIDKSTLIKEKLGIVGYQGGSSGISVRIAKGVSMRSGAHKGQAVRDIISEYFPGVLYLTNERIIFSSEKNGFSQKLNKLTTITPADGGLSLQFGNYTYKIMVPLPETTFLAIKLLSMNN